MKQIKLPSGASVTFRDPKTLRVKDRRKLMTTVDTVQGELAKAMALSDALLSMLNTGMVF
jgi:anthranilate/para-aminobenzoate synthase component I